MSTHQELASFIWQVADLLRGDYKRSEYGKVILPFTVLRRLDCELEPTREVVWRLSESQRGKNIDLPRYLKAAARVPFYNVSRQSFATIGADPVNVKTNLLDYLRYFSPEIQEIIDKYDFYAQVDRLDNAGLLYQVVQKFADWKLNLRPDQIDNHDMGYLFEDLIRRFSELSNETAGEHFTPREIIKLMVELLLAPDDAMFTDGEGQVIDILDPACGTGGMLSAAEEHIRLLNPQARVNLYGQEVNAESYAICRSDLMLKGHAGSNIVFGNSFSQDGHKNQTFHYMLSNPPFGVEWKKVEKFVKGEHKDDGHAGRFGAGLPRINDGSFLFLQHMMFKMKPVGRGSDGQVSGGSRIAIVFNGSPLFSGGAGSGESEIRRWILERDYLEAIVALPEQLFYNTGISTYFWIVTNRKEKRHKGKVILLDARDHWEKLRKSLGEKRKQVSDDQIRHVCRIYRDALDIAADPEHEDHDKVKVFRNEDFGYQRITVDRPLRCRYELTEENLWAIGVAEAVLGYRGYEELLATLKPLVGTIEMTAQAFSLKLFDAYAKAEVPAPPETIEQAILNAVAIKDPEGEIQTHQGKPVHDPDLREFENIPLEQDIDEYFEREVRPYVPDAWIAEIKDPKTKTTTRAKIGYEIPFTRHFYKYMPPRPLAEIDAELRSLEAQIQQLLGRVTL